MSLIDFYSAAKYNYCVMKLKLEQIKSITLGAVNVFEKDGYFDFHRFTPEQEALYDDPKNPRPFSESNVKSLTSAGIKLRFVTNTKSITLTVRFKRGMNRCYYSTDVCCNGKFVGAIASHESIPENLKEDLEEKETTKTFSFDSGEKEICIYLPFSTITTIKDIVLDDGAYVEPVKSDKILLSFGDSITHGYDALRSFNSYANRLADKLNYQIYNKAMGGEIYFPELANTKDSFVPDLITVAYGTNDWNSDKMTPEILGSRCYEFIKNLRENYPNTKIAVISPIWRKELDEEKPFGAFSSVADVLKEQTEKFDNVYFIKGFDFVPKNPSYFSDKRLHPNDKGFEHYLNNLYEEIKKII